MSRYKVSMTVAVVIVIIYLIVMFLVFMIGDIYFSNRVNNEAVRLDDNCCYFVSNRVHNNSSYVSSAVHNYNTHKRVICWLCKK